MTSENQRPICSVCGAAAPGGAPPGELTAAPLDWMRETDPRRGPVWVCPACVRANVRSIEARLEQQWW